MNSGVSGIALRHATQTTPTALCSFVIAMYTVRSQCGQWIGNVGSRSGLTSHAARDTGYIPRRGAVAGTALARAG